MEAAKGIKKSPLEIKPNGQLLSKEITTPITKGVPCFALA